MASIRYIAVGTDSTYTYGRILVSSDSIDWSPATPAINTDTFYCCAWGAGTWVIGGGSNYPTSEGCIETSTDGLNWTRTLSVPGAGTGIFSLNYKNGLFVAFGNTSSTPPNGVTCYTSPDGISWTTVGALVNFTGTGADYGDGLWAIAGGDSNVATTPDLVTFTVNTISAEPNHYPFNLASISFVGSGRFVAQSQAFNTVTNMSDYYTLLSTDDGTTFSPSLNPTWTFDAAINVPLSARFFATNSINGSVIVAVGQGPNAYHYPAGSTPPYTTPTGGPYNLPPAIAISVDRGNTFSYVVDDNTFTGPTNRLPIGGLLNGICNDGTQYLTGGVDGINYTTPQILTSPSSGNSWTVRVPQWTIVGTELVSNPSFIINDTGWTLGSGDVSWSAGHFTSNVLAYPDDVSVSTAIDTVAGNWYQVEIHQTISGDNSAIYFDNNSSYNSSYGITGNTIFYFQADYTGTDNIYIDVDDNSNHPGSNIGAVRDLTYVSVKQIQFASGHDDMWIWDLAVGTPPTPPPPPHRKVRDAWDCDEFGRFQPGACVRPIY